MNGMIKMVNEKGKNMKKVTIIILMVLTVGGIFIGSIVHSLINYHNKNTWANITAVYVKGDESFELSTDKDYMKGDKLEIGDNVIEISWVEHENKAKFRVISGEVSDKTGKSVVYGYLYEGVDNEFAVDGGELHINVNWIRYY